MAGEIKRREIRLIIIRERRTAHHSGEPETRAGRFENERQKYPPWMNGTEVEPGGIITPVEVRSQDPHYSYRGN
jgi:hypothetical protein